MFKNPHYLYGSNDITVPAKLNFGEFFLSKLWEQQDRLAVINGETDESITFKQIAEQAMNVALSLVRIGVRKGDVIGVCSENRKEFWSTIVGIVCAGGIVTTINTGYTKDELNHVMAISKPKYIFVSPPVYKTHGNTFSSFKSIKKIITFGDDRPHNVLLYNDLAKGREVAFEDFQSVDVEGSDDTLFILYSSGTTGLPKGVMLTHLNLLTMSIQSDNVNADERVLAIAPWFHVMGLVSGLTYLVFGRTIVYLPRFEPGLFLKTVEKYQVHQLTVVPAVLIALTKFPSNHDLSSVKRIFSGSAPLRTDTIGAVCEKFPNVDTVRQGYGMTESTLSVCRSRGDDKPRVGSVGLINKAITIKIVDIETQKPVGKYQEGEIRIKGVLVMKGYVGKDRKDDYDEEDFFKTGDIGYYDEDGYLFIVGRLKELIKYKGYQVAPAEIEAVLLQLDGIRDAGVVGISHDTAGEVPLACVVLQPDSTLTEEGIKQFVAEKLSNPKHLRGGVRIVAEIPRNASGKILRKRLRDMVKAKSKL